jgi:L-iditol 2-dehydrogenase
MRALVYRGPNDLRIEERPDPQAAPGEAVLRVQACGICGTDLRIAKGAHRAYADGVGRIPGHEIAGEVVAVGAGVDGVAEHDRVFVAPNVGCGRCAACLAGRVNLCRTPSAFGITMDGAFAEYMRVPAAAVEQGNLLRVPADRDPAAVSVTEPLAAVLRGQRACAVAPDDLVLVCGAGPIGLLHVLAAVAGGARVVVSEPAARRREQALELGAAEAVDPLADDLAEAVAELTGGRGADVVITATPVPAVVEQSVELAAIGGRINFFGGLPADGSTVRLDANRIHYRELVVTGTTANDLRDCREALELVLGGAIDAGALVSGRYPLAQAAAALTAAAGGEALKVVLEPSAA